MNKTNIIFIFLIICIFASCSSKDYVFTEADESAVEENVISIDENGCIQPTINYAYDINLPSEIEINTFPKNIYPSEPWVESGILPEGLVFGDIVYAYQDKKDVEIWIKDRRYHEFAVDNLNFKGKFSGYWVYSTSSKEWEQIPALTNDGKALADTLFTGQNGDLYAVDLPINPGNPFPLLSKFDRSDKKFESIEKTNEVSTKMRTEPYGIISLIDSKGNVWFLVDGDGIYTYNIGMNTFEKQFGFSNDLIPGLENYKVRNAKMGTGDKIYYLFYGENTKSSWMVEFPLYIFETENQNTGRIVPQLSPWPLNYTSFLPDSKENIWFDNVGWIDSKDVWYQLVPSPIFVGLGRSDVYASRLSPAQILLESSDHVLWFHHDNGMMYLDPEKEQWCWFTTYQSNIIEDFEGGLWMIADRRLFKRPLVK